jgi:hypothetical protein
MASRKNISDIGITTLAWVLFAQMTKMENIAENCCKTLGQAAFCLNSKNDKLFI